MPSPIGHSLAGIAAGWSIARPQVPRSALWRQAAILACLAAAPDVDLLIGRHRAEMHSVGAALIVGALAAWRRWPIGSTRTRIFFAAFAAWATHPLLDALAADTTPPLGIMAFWPFSTAYYWSDLPLFAAVDRRWWMPGFVWHNLVAVSRELAILGPVTAAVWWWRARARDAPSPRP